jgi:glycerophosphoryl diester phosphodiesterase
LLAERRYRPASGEVQGLEIRHRLWNPGRQDMEIISHRGHWKAPTEKNQPEAFVRSFAGGFGVETDVRDSGGALVISHDLPMGGEMPLESFFALYVKHGQPGTLALNIKADGLQESLRKSLDQFGIQRYFLFDMSVPDLLVSTRSGLTCFTRESEFEPKPLSLYAQASGVWMDCFDSDWITEAAIEPHLKAGKSVCLVSPELHRRPYLSVWEKYKAVARKAEHRLMLCTDHPLEAKEFFGV